MLTSVSTPAKRQFLELRIGQIDHLGDEVAGLHLVEVFRGELHGNGVVGQERLGARHDRPDFNRRIQFDAGPAGDIGHFQSVDRRLREVVAGGTGQRLASQTRPAR